MTIELGERIERFLSPFLLFPNSKEGVWRNLVVSFNNQRQQSHLVFFFRNLMTKMMLRQVLWFQEPVFGGDHCWQWGAGPDEMDDLTQKHRLSQVFVLWYVLMTHSTTSNNLSNSPPICSMGNKFVFRSMQAQLPTYLSQTLNRLCAVYFSDIQICKHKKTTALFIQSDRLLSSLSRIKFVVYNSFMFWHLPLIEINYNR